MSKQRWRLENLDAVELLESFEDECIDLIITDVAYESLEKHRKLGTTTRLKHSKSSSNDWFQIFPNSRFPKLFEELYRVLKNNTHCYFYCDQETMFVAKPIAEAAGFKFWKPIVWDKMYNGMGYHYRARYEFILFFEKGKRKLRSLSIPDVLEVPRVRGGYPTEKLIALNAILIEQSSEPGELVLDPFMGSGSVGAASLGLSRLFFGNDLSRNAVDTAKKLLLETAKEVACCGVPEMSAG